MHQHLVQLRHQPERLGHPRRRPVEQLTQLHTQHQRTAPAAAVVAAAGNQCNSGIGSVLSGSSR